MAAQLVVVVLLGLAVSRTGAPPGSALFVTIPMGVCFCIFLSDLVGASHALYLRLHDPGRARSYSTGAMLGWFLIPVPVAASAFAGGSEGWMFSPWTVLVVMLAAAAGEFIGFVVISSIHPIRPEA